MFVTALKCFTLFAIAVARSRNILFLKADIRASSVGEGGERELGELNGACEVATVPFRSRLRMQTEVNSI